MAKVVFKNVSKKYGNIVALSNFNLEISDKDFFCIVGPSGSGKTTILRVLAGLENISAGEIYIDDKLINNIQPKDRYIAMVFQNYSLYPHMNVKENMSFGLKMRKYPKVEIEKRVKHVTEILNIAHLLKRKPKHLSGGEKQRVAIGRALVRQPKVFLFDEPFSNLDVRLRSEMRVEIKKLYEKLGVTIIYVTHDQTEAMMLGNRICVLKDGTIQQVDSPMVLYDKPKNKFIAEFMGYPRMNFINVNVLKENSTLIIANKDIKIPIQKPEIANVLSKYINNEILLGIRAEDIILDTNTGSGMIAKIELIELVVPEIILNLSANETQFAVKTNSTNISFKIGQTVLCEFNQQKLHFFDLTKGNSLFF